MRREAVPPQELFGTILQMLEEGYDAEFTVTGNSMWPFLRNSADQVVVRRCEQLRKGDIVLYCPREGQYLLHRVTDIKNEQFRATGDGNCYHDGYFPLSAAAAVVTGVRRKGKLRSGRSMWSGLWMGLFPLRRPLLSLLRFVRRLVK